MNRIHVALVASLILGTMGCASKAPHHNTNIASKGTKRVLYDIIVPLNVIDSMRIECDKKETVAYKLARFEEYLKKEGLDHPQIYLTPKAGAKMCEAKPMIIATRVDDVPLGQNIHYFCRHYGLKYTIGDGFILIDVK